ncbi:MAG: hypothetical protein IPJ28_18445 [Betaproteobacteria bacterium]|nr:hypothetical protein [Betaproteobacteria bacterium]
MPATALLTASVTVQVALAGSVPAVSTRLVAPAPIVAGAKPVQPAPVTVTAPPVATRFAGNGSVRPGFARFKATPLGFAMASESVALALGATAVGLKLLATVTLEKSVAEAAAVFTMPCALPRAAIGIVLVYAPVAVMVTLAVIVQLPPAGMLAPARLNPVPAGAALTVPPQVLAPLGAAVLTRPAG